MTSTHELPGRTLIIATAGVMLALLLAALDQTIVGTALPRILAELQGLEYYSWVVTAYMVSSTVAVPIAGKLGDMFGRKPFLLAGMIGFVAASALCGLSQDMVELVVFRGLQGIFGGILFASAFTVIADLYTPQKRARIQGVFGGVFGLASIIGPTLGGFLTDNWGWRWVFYVNLPVGLIGVLLIMFALPRVRSSASLRDIDVWGSLTLTAGLVPLLIGLSITKDHDWTSWQVMSLLGLAASMLVAFFVIEMRNEHPIVPFELFKNNVFAVSVVSTFFLMFAMFGALAYVALVFQGVLGISATNTGVFMTPMMMGVVVASTLTGQVMIRIKYYRILGTVGALVVAAGMYLLSRVGVGSSQLEATRDLVIIGAGMGVGFPLYITAVQSALPRKFLGVGSSQIQFWRNLGGTVGTAILGTVLAHNLGPNIKSQIDALHLPAAVTSRFAGASSSSSPQALFDPTKLAAARASLPASVQPMFDSIIHATRLGLADTLHLLFLYGAGIVLIAVVVSLFLREVPLVARMPAAVAPDEDAGELAETEPVAV